MKLWGKGRTTLEVAPGELVICITSEDSEYYRVGEVFEVYRSEFDREYLRPISNRTKHRQLSGNFGRWAPYSSSNDVSDLL